MSIVIGPVLKRPDGYGFDVWTVPKGATRGYPYCRIEDAYYARNAEIRASARGRAPAAIACRKVTIWLSSGSVKPRLPSVALTDGFTTTYPDINTYTGQCMTGGTAATHGNEFLIPAPQPLPPCASAICGVQPLPAPNPLLGKMLSILSPIRRQRASRTRWTSR